MAPRPNAEGLLHALYLAICPRPRWHPARRSGAHEVQTRRRGLGRGHRRGASARLCVGVAAAGSPALRGQTGARERVNACVSSKRQFVSGSSARRRSLTSCSGFRARRFTGASQRITQAPAQTPTFRYLLNATAQIVRQLLTRGAASRVPLRLKSIPLRSLCRKPQAMSHSCRRSAALAEKEARERCRPCCR